MPSSPAISSAGDDQVRARRSVAGSNLDARPRAAFVRHATERGAVVVTPVRVGGRERVRQDALVRVDRRAEQCHETRRVVDHPCDELRGERAQALSAGCVAERVVPVLRSERQVDVEAGPALVGKRPAHEGRDEALTGGDLLHGCLQHEGTVCGVDRGGVLDVDLVLRVHELVVRGVGVEPELVAPEQHP